jgi:leucyl/phenylalanyl-tRNA--protein transferase
LTPSIAEPWWETDPEGAPPAGPRAVGGEIDAHTILEAARRGWFPLPSDDEQQVRDNRQRYGPYVGSGASVVVPTRHPRGPFATTWWNPATRPLIGVGRVHLSRSLRRALRNRHSWLTTADACFDDVVSRCAAERSPAWITPALARAFTELHVGGWAHSIEVWDGEELIAGLFGLALGEVFSVESTFHERSGAGRVAVADLDDRLGVTPARVIDLQWAQPHVLALGAGLVTRDSYLRRLAARPAQPAPWEISRRDSSRLGREAETRDVPLLERIAGHARRDPAHAAIVDGSLTLSYAELVERVDERRRALVSSGVRAGHIVALRGDRSHGFVTWALAVLACGAGYLPVSPAVPEARYRELSSLAEAAAEVDLRTDQETPSVRRLTPSEEQTGTWPHAAAPSVAWLVHTSGTTGRPVGVRVDHRQLDWHARTMAAAFALTPADRVLHCSGVDFDVAAEELWPTLDAGATVIVCGTPLAALDYERFDGLVRSNRISVVNLPSSYFAGWAGQRLADGTAADGSLRLVVAGSEPLPLEIAEQWCARPDSPRLLNAYGLTETTVTSCIAELRSDVLRRAAGVPLGSPVDGMDALVLDESRRPVHGDGEGQLVLSGEGIATLDPPRRDDAFVAVDGRRWFLTGDRVRRTDGLLVHLGRIDSQVKLRGYRIDPDDVRLQLNRLVTPADTHVLVIGDELVGFVAGAAGDDRTAGCREALASVLPPHLVPSRIVSLPRWPRTSGGKIDTRRLMELPTAFDAVPPFFSSPAAGPVLTAQDVIDAAAHVLGRPCSPGTHFFDAGGTSLDAARLTAAVARRGGGQMPLEWVFMHPVLGELAAVMVPDADRKGEDRA